MTPQNFIPSIISSDTHNHRNNSNSNSSLDENNQDYDSTSSSVIDLLLSLTRRRSVSSSDIDHWIDAGEDEIDNFDGEEVRRLFYNFL